jgi:hypothetical protein
MFVGTEYYWAMGIALPALFACVLLRMVPMASKHGSHERLLGVLGVIVMIGTVALFASSGFDPVIALQRRYYMWMFGAGSEDAEFLRARVGLMAAKKVFVGSDPMDAYNSYMLRLGKVMLSAEERPTSPIGNFGVERSWIETLLEGYVMKFGFYLVCIVWALTDHAGVILRPLGSELTASSSKVNHESKYSGNFRSVAHYLSKVMFASLLSKWWIYVLVGSMVIAEQSLVAIPCHLMLIGGAVSLWWCVIGTAWIDVGKNAGVAHSKTSNAFTYNVSDDNYQGIRAYTISLVCMGLLVIGMALSYEWWDGIISLPEMVVGVVCLFLVHTYMTLALLILVPFIVVGVSSFVWGGYVVAVGMSLCLFTMRVDPGLRTFTTANYGCQALVTQL